MITVVGGGFSGCLTAYLLCKAGKKVQIFEPNSKLGGLIQTSELSSGSVESAANGWISNPLLEEVAKDLGVELVGVSKKASAKYFFVGKLTRWPLSFGESLRFLIKLFLSILFAKLRPQAHESLKVWGDRALGPSFTEKVLRVAVLGIYAEKIEVLSASLILSRFFTKTKKQKTNLRGTVCPKNGMSEWFSKMKIFFEKNHVPIIEKKFSFEFSPTEPVILCTSSLSASEMLKDYDTENSVLLSRVKLQVIVSVSIFLERTESLEAFGCLLHPNDQFNSLGILFNHCNFPHRQKFQSETYILKGNPFLQMNDTEIIEKILQDRKRVFQTENKIIEYRITRWPTAFPSYDLELEEILSQLKQKNKNYFLNGNYLGSLGLSQIAFRSQKIVNQVSSYE